MKHFMIFLTLLINSCKSDLKYSAVRDAGNQPSPAVSSAPSPSPTPIIKSRLTAIVGFVTRTSFKIKADFSESSVSCILNDTTISKSKNSSGWLTFDGLASDTIYSLRCEDKLSYIEVKARTFSRIKENISPDNNFVQDGVTYNPGTCFAHSRAMKYNSYSGSLDMFGSSLDGTITNSCFVTYNGLKWEMLRFDYFGDAGIAGVDYNSGYGLSYLADGTTVALNSEKFGSLNNPRVNFCKNNCGVKSNWTSFSYTKLDGSSTALNACQSSINVDYAVNKLVMVSACGNASYAECDLNSDCSQLGNWSAPLTLHSAGAGTHSSPFRDINHGLWFTSASSTQPFQFCSKNADCKQLSSWNMGTLPGIAYGPTNLSQFEMAGQIMTISFSNGTDMVTAYCDTSSLDCGYTNGSNVFSNFTVSSFAKNNNYNYTHKIAGGYLKLLQDSSDGQKAKVMDCYGSFQFCGASLANWSIPHLLPDGLDHIWDMYHLKSSFTDANGEPMTALQSGADLNMSVFYYLTQ